MHPPRGTLLLCALALSCGGESGPGGSIGSIVVTPNPIALAQQASLQLQVSILDDEGVLLTGVPVTFASDNTALVTVSNTGVVQSVGPAGATAIRVRAGLVSRTVPITVTATGNTIRILPFPAVVAQGQSLQLDVALLDLVGTPIPGTTFTFFSLSPGIATVNADGLVTSVGPGGQAIITASTGELSAQVHLTVTQFPTSLDAQPSSITTGSHGKVTLTARVLDAIGAPINGVAAVFSAQPASLLTVTQAGELQALGTPGSGTVTVLAGSFSAQVPVTILDGGPLHGTIVETAPASGAPYGVILAPGASVLGVGIHGMLHVGTFDSPGVSTHQLSSYVTIGIARNPSSGAVYVTGAGPDALMEVDPVSGSVLRRWPLEVNEQTLDVAVSSDGEKVFVVGNSGTLYVLAAATLTKTGEHSVGGAHVHLVAHPSQPLVYASGQGSAVEVNVQTGSQRTFVIESAQATALALSSDRLYIGAEGGTMGVVNLATGSVALTNISGCPIYDVVAAPGGGQLLVTCSQSGTALILDAESLVTLATISTGGYPRRAAISPDGLSAVIANEAGWYTHVR